MSTLSDLLAEHTGVSGGAVDHLQTVVAEWQMLSDLSFADFLLWVPEAAGHDAPPAPGTEARFICVAQARPTTGPTAHPEDVVASHTSAEEHPQLRRAIVERRICREEDPRWYLGVPVRREAIPVKFGGEVVAVLSRETNLAVPRVPSALEIAYLGIAGDLCQMVADGTFPTTEPSPDVHTSPRVGDGLIRLDTSGAVVFASPNALSAYHRMGHASDLVGVRLAPLTRSLIADPFDATEVAQRILSALEGQPGMRTEAESRRGAAVLFRALPLRPGGKAAGALVLCRDVTEVRRRDRALLSKDATIREIHHRVKNNLQTVAALLRLQSRRTSSPEAKEALAESVRRVAAIAMVHETLSTAVDERVDLDSLVDKVIPVVGDVAVAESHVKVRKSGQFGVVAAETATPLVMVLTELIQNAVEHAFPPGSSGEVVVSATRSARWLDVVVADDGRGLPSGFSLERANGLGLQIVRTLVESELRGTLSLRRREHTGTEAVLRVPLSHRR
ncbi:histidine kinase N-terminal domain-containing protein [Actinokineospora auranticolor]|uniref:histidine kinase n=1 Tax=Actinokineospora auranticolor TaxID=155976 RepID=A0A2S6GXB9_9PSEU|nr:PAS domain-containing sensor histidine kinase [Actinokineospora auranticolor]PPK69853.1 two-component sensor histidine kinase [Actinokineospora auranticolor]